MSYKYCPHCAQELPPDPSQPQHKKQQLNLLDPSRSYFSEESKHILPTSRHNHDSSFGSFAANYDDGWQPVQRVAAGASTTADTYEKEHTSFVPTVHSNVSTPLYSAIVTAVIVFATFYTTAWYFDDSSRFTGGLALACWTLLFSWFTQSAHFRNLIKSVERRSRSVDPLQPVQQQQQQPTEIVYISSDSDAGEVNDIGLRLPIDNDKFLLTAKKLRSGQTLTSKAKWLTTDEAKALKKWMREHGYMKLRHANNENSGLELTKKGDALIRGYIEAIGG